MKKVTMMGAALGLLGMSASAFAQFAGGNLVLSVAKAGTGNTLSNAATRHILRELTPAGVPTATPDVQIYGLASEVSGNNRRATLSGTASSEGFLNLSTDGKYIIFAGYDADIGTPTVKATTSLAVNRVIGRYDWSQAPSATTLDTSTFITDGYSGDNFRDAASDNGLRFWGAGTSSNSTGGTRYIDYSATPTGTSLALTAAPLNTRVVKIYNGQLYVSSSSGTAVGLNTVGTGLPTTSGQTVTRIVDGTIGTTKTSSAYDFVFDTADIVYIADDTTGTAATVNGGLQKWVKGDSGTFTNTVTYTIPNVAGTANVGLRGLARRSSTTYYATTTDKRLIQIDLTGNTPTDRTITTLVTAASDEDFRDVEVLPLLNNSISGKITFQAGLENVPLNQPLRITLTPIAPTTGNPINTTVTPDANGNFTVSAPPGTYRLQVKTAHTLSEAANVNSTSGNVTGVNFTLRGGDINDDNAVDINDLLALISAYNQASPAAGYSPAADINNDGVDDIQDLLLLIANYNKAGNS